MAGILDLHAVAALQNGWEGYMQTNSTLFKQLFFGIKESVLQEWYDSFISKPPSFRINAAPSSDSIPTVVIQLLDESRREEPLGGLTHYEADGTPQYGMILSQRIRISTLAQSPELARALHVVCRAIMQVSIQDLTQAGYTAVEFDGTDELSVEEMLAAEEMGIYVRHQTWSAMSQVEIRGWTATAATKPWFVLGNHNTTSTGESGGVKIMTTS